MPRRTSSPRIQLPRTTASRAPSPLAAVVADASAAAHMITPLGRAVALASDDAVIGLFIGEETATSALGLPISDLSRRAAREIAEYFTHRRREFTVPISPHGSPLERAVWAYTYAVPYGETTTYTDVTACVGRPSDLAAVVTALERNPCRVLVPCHRVVTDSGGLGIFSLGPSAKRFLLEHEQTPVES